MTVTQLGLQGITEDGTLDIKFHLTSLKFQSSPPSLDHISSSILVTSRQGFVCVLYMERHHARSPVHGNPGDRFRVRQM